jgi:hypothetical protein
MIHRDGGDKFLEEKILISCPKNKQPMKITLKHSGTFSTSLVLLSPKTSQTLFSLRGGGQAITPGWDGS